MLDMGVSPNRIVLLPECPKYSVDGIGDPAEIQERKSRTKIKNNILEEAIMAVEASSMDEHQGRWGQLIIGIICMVMIANLQYGWNLFVEPMSHQQHWTRAVIGGAFGMFVLAEN